MIDSSCSDEFEADLTSLITSQAGVDRLDKLLTRKFGSKIYVEAEIAVDGTIALSAAHTIADTVHDEVEKAYPEIKHIMIHENPL